MGPSEKFEVIKHEDGRVSLKAANGKYVSCDSPTAMKAAASRMNEGEKFKVEVRTDCDYAHPTCIMLKASNGKYAISEYYGGKVRCDCTDPTSYATFFGPFLPFKTGGGW